MNLNPITGDQMKNVAVTILSLFLFNVSSAYASEAIKNPALIEALDVTLTESGVASGFIGQGWVGQAAIVRCADPEGTGNPKDKRYCAFAPVNLNDSREVEVGSNALTALLFTLTSQSKVATGFVQNGWVGQAAILRCLSPEGTGNPKDKKYCELDAIQN
jgi:hypothetical protein